MHVFSVPSPEVIRLSHESRKETVELRTSDPRLALRGCVINGVFLRWEGVRTSERERRKSVLHYVTVEVRRVRGT